MERNSDRGLGDHPIVVILGLLSTFLAIFIFVTGFENLPQLLDRGQQESDPQQFSKEVAKPTATIRPLVQEFQTISLERWSELEAVETNLGVAPGSHNFLGVPFETGWTTSTQCEDAPGRWQSIPITTKISNPTHVYLLIQAGYAYSKFDGKQVGTVKLNFDDGSSAETPLTLGFNIRDWAWENPAAVNTASSDSLQAAVQGVTSGGTPGGMDMLTIDIPDNLLNSTLTGIEISDVTTETIGDMDPCIHLVAITVEHLR